MTVSGTTASSTTSSSTSTGTVLTADQMLAKAKGDVNAGDASANGILSASDLLDRASQRAQGINPTDTVSLSSTATATNPVQKLLDATAAAKKSPRPPITPIRIWYIKAKVSQLKQQIALYTSIPGLDSSGAILDSLTKQVNDLATKQHAKVIASTNAAAAAQKRPMRQRRRPTTPRPARRNY